MIRKLFKLFLAAILLTALYGGMYRPANAGETGANPHLREGCLLCHRSGDAGPHEGTRIITPEEEGPHAVLGHSCRTCHKEGKGNFWIVVLPEGGTPAPGGGPSGRGPAAQPPAETTDREEGFSNSHDGQNCTDCHEVAPGRVEGRLPGPFPYGEGGVESFCRKCHAAIDQTHFPRGNRPRKSITCLNCHQAHGSSPLYPSLREDYPGFLIESADINPHGGRIFCLSCHRDSPRGGEAVTFRGDTGGLCRRCHSEVEHHPLGVTSSPGTWKMDFSDFPLEEEKLTCVTCHDPYECEDIVTRDNPRFLRGGPYNTVEDFCVRCHEGRSFINLNPHDQIDEEGKVREKQCLYCHTTPPETGYDLGPEDFTDNLEALCVSCHALAPHPDVNHMVDLKPSMLKDIQDYEERRLVSLPTDGDRLTCVTCHNPHERGLMAGPAGVGADEENLLRLATFQEICTPCHGRR